MELARIALAAIAVRRREIAARGCKQQRRTTMAQQPDPWATRLYTTEEAISFAAKHLPGPLYQNYSPQERKEVRERAEALAKRYPRSYLARKLNEFYKD